MRFAKGLFGTSLVALLGACGGGGETDIFDPAPQVGLASLADTATLNSMSGSDVGVAFSQAAKSASEDLWDDSATLIYVARLEEGQAIVGQALEDIPTSVSFQSDGTGLLYAIVGEEQLVLSDGDVAGSISAAGALDVTVSGDATSNLQIGDNGTKLLSMNVVTDTSGDGCLASYVLCGGDMTLTAGTSEYSVQLANTQFSAGVFGTSAANAELGGIVEYQSGESGDGVNRVAGSFIAGQ